MLVNDPSPPARRMTADEVLEVIIDHWRQIEGIDPNAQYRIPLSRNTNVERAANLLGQPRFEDDWIDIAILFKYMFRVAIEKDEWKAVLHPREQKSLGPVCDLIAEHALAPAIVRERFGERLDDQAAMFHTIMLVLQDADVSTGGLTPQSKLQPVVAQHERELTEIVARIAPGRMPAVKTTNHSLRASAIVIGLGLTLLLLDIVVNLPHVVLPAKLALLIGGLGLFVSFARPVKRYRLGELDTFGDLSYALSSPMPPESELLYWEDDSIVRWDRSCHPTNFEAGTSPLALDRREKTD